MINSGIPVKPNMAKIIEISPVAGMAAMLMAAPPPPDASPLQPAATPSPPDGTVF